MALFNLDIERYYQAKKEEGFELKSIAYLQYPIYCIHATILDSTPDPLDKLDKAIMRCLLIKSDMTILNISRLLSVQKKGIEMRMQQIKSEGLIEGEKKYRITQLGNKVTNGTEKRLLRRQHNFYLDGVDLKPLSSELYSPKYLKSLIDENEYTYYTNFKGETKSNKPFKPNIVHKPILKETVYQNILAIPENERKGWSIPLGLEKIENSDFTKMSFPVLIGLMVKNGIPYRELIDGFSSLGEPEKIEAFVPKIKSKTDKLELRMDTWQTKENDKFSFSSNWGEIDKENNDDQLQFITNEDLKLAFKKLYKIEFLSDEEIINTKFEIGINITKQLLLNIKSNRKKLLNNLERGRDYQMTSLRNGMWIVFISFKTEAPFVNTLLEIKKILEEIKNKKIEIENIKKILSEYKIYRQALVLLEEYELLEKIDINLHMNIKK